MMDIVGLALFSVLILWPALTYGADLCRYVWRKVRGL